MYLNNIKIRAIFFTDDLVITFTSPQGLQRQINKFAQYCEQNRLGINTNKTKVMITDKLTRRMARRNKNHDDRFYVNEVELEKVSSPTWEWTLEQWVPHLLPTIQ